MRSKILLDKAFKAAAEKLASEGGTQDTSIDVSLTGRAVECGALHPITQINQQICDIFSNLGFDIAEGPEVESDYYNFEALNFPKDHPARDMQDTFFITRRYCFKNPYLTQSNQNHGETIAAGTNHRARQGLSV